jgi:AraC family transcriptional regulator
MKTTIAPREAHTEGVPPHRPELARALTFIESHLAEPLPVARIAREVGLSPYYFSHLFKATFGTSPHQHVLDRRLQHAHTLLRHTELSIGEIAQETGFRTQSHLAKTFKQCFGHQPREVRAQCPLKHHPFFVIK